MNMRLMHILKNEIFILAVLLEACNKFRGPSPLLSAVQRSSEFRTNIASLATMFPTNCLAVPGVVPQNSRNEAMLPLRQIM